MTSTATRSQVLSIPVSIVLLARLRRRHVRASCGATARCTPAPIPTWRLAAPHDARSSSRVATVATAVVAEILVGSIEAFAEKAHLSDFFVAAVIVAIVGNAAEHGGAVIVAHRGRVKLATEIALSSSAQVARLPDPGGRDPLLGDRAARARLPPGRDRRDGRLGDPGCWRLLAARQVELLARRGRSSGGYVVAAVVFYKAGGR